MIGSRTLLLLILIAALVIALASPAMSAKNDRVSFGEEARVPLGKVVTGNIVAFGGDASVSGIVGGDVVVFGGNVRLNSTADVRGDVIDFGGTVKRMPGSQVRGQVISGLPAAKTMMGGMTVIGHFGPIAFFLRLLGLLGWLVITAIIIYMFPQHQEFTARYLEVGLTKAFLLGLLALICIGPIAILLIVTIIGIPLIPFVVFFYIAAGIFGRVAVGLWFGGSLLTAANFTAPSVMTKALAGSAVLCVLMWIPIAGPVLLALANIIGLGVALSTKFGTGQAWFKPQSSRRRAQMTVGRL